MHVQIIDYRPQYQADFQQLNESWLKQYFTIEPIDHQVLSNPQHYILHNGGKIWFAAAPQEKNKIVGCVAVLVSDDNKLELTKMAVAEGYRGHKIGQRLAQHAINFFLNSSYQQLFLESSLKLTEALTLYEKLGFEHFPVKADSHYKRADVHMIFNPAKYKKSKAK